MEDTTPSQGILYILLQLTAVAIDSNASPAVGRELELASFQLDVVSHSVTSYSSMGNDRLTPFCYQTYTRSGTANTRVLGLHLLILASTILGQLICSDAAAISRTVAGSAAGGEAWENPCNLAELPHSDPIRTDDNIEDEHIMTMRASLQSISEMSREMLKTLTDRLPSLYAVPADSTITGMAVHLLTSVNSTSPQSLEGTQLIYELFARGYIHVHHMIQSEFGERNLVTEMSSLRSALKVNIMCPVYSYSKSAHSAYPLGGLTQRTLTDLLQATATGIDFQYTRNQRNVMIIRDFIKITDYMHNNIYTI